MCGARIGLIALLCVGSAVPQTGRAHTEGIEAADPSTPSALLMFQGATSDYTRSNGQPLQWRSLFESGADSRVHTMHDSVGTDMDSHGNAHSGHAGAAQTSVNQ